MSLQSIEEVLSIQKNLNSERSNQENFMDWVEHYVEIMHPDFIVVLDVQSENPFIYQKNYHLEFPKGSLESVEEIRDGVSTDQNEKLLAIDMMVAKFFIENNVEPKKGTIHLRCNTELIPNNVRSFLRSMTLIENDQNGRPKLILLSIMDVTEIHGNKLFMSIDVKNYGVPNLDFDTKLIEFKRSLVEVFSVRVNLTEREKLILDLISEGKTSKQIGEILNISVNTVNTHRQNLIRKNKVKNTSALLRSVF